MERIYSLTPDQQAKLSEWTKRWIEIGLSTDPADFDSATEAALRGYKLANHGRPMVILRMGSPYAATVGGAIAWVLLRKIFGSNVDAKVRDQVRNQVGEQVRAQVVAQVRDQVWDQVWDQFDDQTGEIYRAVQDGRSNYGHDALWGTSFAAWVSFLRDVCDWSDPILEKFDVLETIVKSCGWTWWHHNVLAISDRPRIINRDERGRLHSLNGPAISYPDGWAIHAVHGVRVPAWIIEKPDQITIAAIDGETNAEIRRIMLERFGVARYVRESGARVLDECSADHPIIGLRTARLYRKHIADDEPIVMLDMLNSTPEPDGTKKRYMIRVDPNAYGGIKTCLAAMASTYRLSDGSLLFQRPQDYSPTAES